MAESDIQVLQRMNPNDFGDSQIFPPYHHETDMYGS